MHTTIASTMMDKRNAWKAQGESCLRGTAQVRHELSVPKLA